MIKRQTLENYVKYCKDLILSIKTRQRVESSRTKVINNYGAGAGSNWDIAIPIHTIYTDLANYPAKIIKIRFKRINEDSAWENGLFIEPSDVIIDSLGNIVEGMVYNFERLHYDLCFNLTEIMTNYE